MVIESQRRLRLLAIVHVALSALTLSSCSLSDTKLLLSHQVPRTQEEAGTTHIAVLSVQPWAEARESLQPNFSLTEAQALEIAGVSTQAFEEKVVDALEMMVKLAPPTDSASEVRRKTSGLSDSDGKPLPAYTSERTDTRTAGDLGDVPAAPATAGLTDFPPPAGTSPLAKTLSLEPMLKYAAATALFQETKLLNSYVENAVQRHGYDAYVVRLQVSLMPSARKQPVDAYSTFSFFLGDGISATLSASGALRSNAVSENVVNSALSSAYHLTAEDPRVKKVVLSERFRAAVRESRSLSELSEAVVGAEQDKVLAACIAFQETALAPKYDRPTKVALEVGGELSELKDVPRQTVGSVPLYLEIAAASPRGHLLKQAIEELQRESARWEECKRSSTCVADESDKKRSREQNSYEEACRTAALTVQAKGTPFVVPLLVTDDLELSAQARSLNQARQFAFGLAAMAQGFGGSVSSSRTSRKLQALAGNDINSLMTVARVTDNSMRVRFGAMQQASSQYAMVPRTNNVTLLLLVPGAADEALGGPTSIQVVEQTSLVNAMNGKLIGRGREADAGEVCRSLLRGYDRLVRRPVPDCAAIEQSLLDSVLLNDFDGFRVKVESKVAGGSTFPTEQLWLDFAAATARSAYASTNFELPMVTKPQYFCEQAGVIRDDGKAVAKVALRRGGRLSSKDLGASLIAFRAVGTAPAVTACDEFSLPGGEVVINPSGRDAVFVFPSAKALGLSYICQVTQPASGTQQAATLEVSCPSCDPVPPKDCSRPAAVAGTVATYKLLEPPAAAPAKAEDPDRLAMAVWPDSVVADASGRGTLTLHFEKVKDASDFWIGFSVSGGDVVGGSVIPAAVGDDVKRGIITGSAQHIVVELSLMNLIPQASVTITAFDIANPQPGKALVRGDVEITESRRVIQILAPQKTN